MLLLLLLQLLSLLWWSFHNLTTKRNDRKISFLQIQHNAPIIDFCYIKLQFSFYLYKRIQLKFG